MWQRTCSSTLLKVGLLAATWTMGARGASAGSSSLFPLVTAVEVGTRGSSSPLALFGTPVSGLLDPPAWSFTAEEALPTVTPPVSAALASPARETDAADPSLSGPQGAAAAMREIQAAAAGSLSLDDTASPCCEPGCPASHPALTPTSPCCPAAPASPDPRALLAMVALPAWTAIRPLRRRGRGLIGAVAERLFSVLGLLLIVLWAALTRGK